LSAATDRHGRQRPSPSSSLIFRVRFFTDGLFYERRQRARRTPPGPPPSGWLILLRWVVPSVVVCAVILCGWTLQAFDSGWGTAVTLLAVFALLIGAPVMGRSPGLLVVALVGTGFFLSLLTWTGGHVMRDYVRETRGHRVEAVVTGYRICDLTRLKGTGLCSYRVAALSDHRPLGTVGTGHERIGDRLTVVDVAGHPEFTERPGKEEPGFDITLATLAVLLVWGEFGAAALAWRARRRRTYTRWQKARRPPALSVRQRSLPLDALRRPETL
jgi:hypothetical protein